MTFYVSPNTYTAYGCDNPFYWNVKSVNYNSMMDVTYITIDFGYDGDINTETRNIGGDVTADPEAAVIGMLSEYAFSTGPIHGGGFPIRP